MVGAKPHPLRDAYHLLLRIPWWGLLSVIAGAFPILNVLFAALYFETGGIAGARDGSFRDAFFFSVQTMGTIGYGAMYPKSDAANWLVVAESVAGLIMTALATGLVFARFSQSTGMLVFAEKATISPMDGLPTLGFRIGNDRSNTIFEATVRVVAFRTERTKEGVLFYRMYDLPLVRERTPALARSWNVLHVIDDRSPLWNMTPESCHADEVELVVSVVGTDDTSLQPVHGRHRYVTRDIVWGARPADILTEKPDGTIQLDLRRFHDVVQTDPTPEFPYPKKAAPVTAA